MPESTIINEVTQCPVCHSVKTIYREANIKVIAEGKATKYIPMVSLNGQPPAEIVVIPLNNPSTSLVVEFLIQHYDTCICGFRYCVLAEKSSGVVSMQQQPQSQLYRK